MNRQGLERVIDSASFVTGLPLHAEGQFEDRNQPIEVRVSGLSEIDTFHFRAHRSPMAWFVDLHFDTFARPLIHRIVSSVVRFDAEFQNEISRIRANDIQVEYQVGSGNLEESSEDPQDNFFKLRLVSAATKPQDSLSLDEEVGVLSVLIEEALILVTYILSDFDTTPLGIHAFETEGVASSNPCQKYSRSARNRKRCLEHYGFLCQGCGLDPARTYGEKGRQIIHVHHLTPLSHMEAPGPINPINELIPLCPNCHNFVHKRNPPLSLDELKSVFPRES
jgi:5-methylcytosine-specific restriction enzyme A